ncbi:flavin-containing monooxygenase [Rhodococcus koreensis]|uniref:flavin-containing monooxygenase n=1 Tax=Rhodococcus koreensis TaxID=99653 RepID=UPI00366B55B8
MVSSSTQLQNGHGTQQTDFDVIVVGAGFAGLYAMHKYRDIEGLSVLGLEAASDVGGTWYWNRYPGARCDVESYTYSYSFDPELMQEWSWSERYAAQPEILRYLNHVADKFDLRPNFKFDRQVIAGTFDEERNRWVIETKNGETYTAQFLHSGVGFLSAAKTPEFEGLDNFKGNVYTTSSWPHEGVDFTGRRVAVIGTGSSGIQLIPIVAQQAGALTVFQRTPNYATPLGNGVMDPEFEAQIKANYDSLIERARKTWLGIPYDTSEPSALEVSDEERRARFEEKYRQGGFRLVFDSYADLVFNQEANDHAAEFIRDKIRGRVEDPEVAELLTPRGYPYGTKRPPLETNYYETYNRENVTLIDLQTTPLERITETGIKTSDGEFEFDDIILATGFDALTGPVLRMNLRGRGGVPLAEYWEHGARTYFGRMIRNFPNLVMALGPQSPSALYSIPFQVQDTADWTADLIRYMRANGLETIEPTAEAEDAWGAQTSEIANFTLLPQANSWYMGANVPGKPRACLVFLGGGPAYYEAIDKSTANGYEGFELQPARQAVQ